MGKHSTKKTKANGKRGRPIDPQRRKHNLQRLLNAAYTLFVQEGYDAVSVQKIAKAGGQSKGAFYWYFADKKDCIVQVLQAEAKTIQTQLDLALKATQPVKDRLLQMSDFRLWQKLKVNDFVCLLNVMTYSKNESVREVALNISSDLTRNGCELFRHLGREAARDAGWKEDDLRSFDFFTWAMCYIGCYEGVYNILARRNFASPPNNERVAHTIHLAFVKPLIEMITTSQPSEGLQALKAWKERGGAAF